MFVERKLVVLGGLVVELGGFFFGDGMVLLA
jgi:hypothetical protein